MLALRIKKAVRKGATLVVADPRAIWLTKIAKRHLQLRPGSDVWLLNAMMHVDPRGGPAGGGVHPRAHRGLRGRPRRGRAVHARGGGALDGRAGRGDPRHRARVRDRAARGDLLHARHHRARLRRRQHLVARQPRPADGAPRVRVDRAERAARPEQRPGPQRLGREPVLPPRLPAHRRPGGAAEVLGGVGRRGAGAGRLPARPDDVGPPRRPCEGALPDRREPGADRAERAPRRGGAHAARVPRLAGHLPERHGGEARQRRPAGVELRGEGRHVHQHGAAREPRARGSAVPRRGPRRPRDRDRSRARARLRLARVPGRGVGLERARRPLPELVRDPLLPLGGGRAAVAGCLARGRGLAVPAREDDRAPVRAGASSIPSSTSRRSRSPTPTIRSSSRPGGRSTTTTRRG